MDKAIFSEFLVMVSGAEPDIINQKCVIFGWVKSGAGTGSHSVDFIRIVAWQY